MIDADDLAVLDSRFKTKEECANSRMEDKGETNEVLQRLIKVEAISQNNVQSIKILVHMGMGAAAIVGTYVLQQILGAIL